MDIVKVIKLLKTWNDNFRLELDFDVLKFIEWMNFIESCEEIGFDAIGNDLMLVELVEFDEAILTD